MAKPVISGLMVQAPLYSPTWAISLHERDHVQRLPGFTCKTSLRSNMSASIAQHLDAVRSSFATRLTIHLDS